MWETSSFLLSYIRIFRSSSIVHRPLCSMSAAVAATAAAAVQVDLDRQVTPTPPSHYLYLQTDLTHAPSSA